jgi:hypothetical protein
MVASAAAAAPDLAVFANPAAPATVTAAAAGGPATAASPVVLITGMRFGLASGPNGQPEPVMLPASKTLPASQTMPITGLNLAGRSFEIPADALPYLGHGLDPSLFDLAALRRLEHGGRLPVQVTYQGQVPVIPGIQITGPAPGPAPGTAPGTAQGTAHGYLTAASALRFGVALRRQFWADHDRASYGTDGLFAHGVSIALAGARAASAPRPVRPQFQMHTLTLHAKNLAGKPDNGDDVIVFNTDDAARFGDPIESDTFFEKGVAKFSVPEGHYWAIADFLSGGFSDFKIREVIVPQITVHNDQAHVSIDERSASSKLRVTTPRPAVPELVTSLIFRTPGLRGGEPSSAQEILLPGWSLWMNPTHKKPSVGGLETFTQFQLASPVSRPGVPYAYNLDFEGPAGLIPSQHFTARASRLATIDNRYFQDFPSVGGFVMSGGTREEFSLDEIIITGSVPIRLPGHLIEYATASPDVVWSQTYFQFVDVTPGFPTAAGGQSDAFRSFGAGQHVIEDWNDYPLHPQPLVSLTRFGGIFASVPSAARVGDLLTLAPVVFSDSTSGHLGAGYLDGTGFDTGMSPTVSGRFRIEQNGKTLASGNAVNGVPQVKLSNRPSVVRFTLTARRTDPRYDLSTASDTTWTWRSRPAPAATVSAPWECLPKGANAFNGPFTRHCAVQPMLTLGYQIAGLHLNGTAAPGRQVIRLSAGHLQQAGNPAVTRTAMRVSFNGGKTWRAARITPAGKPGQFTAEFTAPAKALVTLRVTSADKAGGSVEETITSAYKTS